jgi:hypothetical protein
MKGRIAAKTRATCARWAGVSAARGPDCSTECNTCVPRRRAKAVPSANSANGSPIRLRASNWLVLCQIAGMVEPAGLQIGTCQADFRNGGLGQNLGRDIVDRGIGDLVDEADVLVLAGGYARDHFAPGDFGIDDGFAPAPSLVDHYDEILHGGVLFEP